jgi:hypothetical protein
MPLSNVPFMPRDGTIVIKDSTATPITLTVSFEDGDFAFDELTEGYADTIVLKDRGTPYAMRKSEGQVPTFTFSAHATDFTDATDKTLMDACLKKGVFATGVSALGASADVWALNVKFTADTSAIGGTADSVEFKKCRLSCSFSEGAPGKFSLKGQILITTDSDVVWA